MGREFAMPNYTQYSKAVVKRTPAVAAKAEPTAAEVEHTPGRLADTNHISFSAAPNPIMHAMQLSHLSSTGTKRTAAQLQRAYGNRYACKVAAQAAPLVVQPKLTVTPPGDKYEDEA